MRAFVSKWVIWAILNFIRGTIAEIIQMPRFVGPVDNVTVPVGREGIITCSVDSLGSYKVAWVRVDTQTILTIHTHVITRSHRIQLSHTDSWTWNLHIKHVREQDRGWYMCQINTDPMMSQTGYLQVVVPPDILDYPTSTDMVVREGTNVTLQCAATGFPKPSVTWRREDKLKISFADHEKEQVEGAVFNLSKVNRLHMGAYLCIATNGIPPTVSRRISIIVHFPPMIWIPNMLVGATEGQDIILECHSEAYPKSINYWARDNGQIITTGEKYESKLVDGQYKVTMKLTIRNVNSTDFGQYVCLSKNSLGDTDGKITLYPLIPSTLAAKTTTLPSSSSAVSSDKAGGTRRTSSVYDVGANKTKNGVRAGHIRGEMDNSLKPLNVKPSNEVVANDLDDTSRSSIIRPSHPHLAVCFTIFVSIVVHCRILNMDKNCI